MGRGRLTETRLASRVEPVPEALKAYAISKRFGATRALEHLDITVATGEVHGLVGENGSGKTTLIRILAGYHVPDPGGHLEVGGRQVRFPLAPGEPRRLGMSFVHQDLGLIPSLSVLENLRLGDLATRGGLRVDWRRELRVAKEVLDRHELRLDPAGRVASLTPTERALLAIVRAVEELPAAGSRAAPPGLLVLDEPGAFLPRVESERLGRLMRAVADSGAGVLFVSHDLDEVVGAADRVTVLRDGRARGTVPRRQAAAANLAELMTGRRLAPAPARRGVRPVSIPTVAHIAGLCGGRVRELSFSVGRGEVLGLTGLAGSGYDEVASLLCGVRPARAGRLVLDGTSYLLAGMTPTAARQAGIAFVPADRHRQGAVGSLPVADNITLPVLDRYRRGGRIDQARRLGDVAALLAAFAVSPAEPDLPWRALSGGNQQKALVAKWLATSPALLLLDEPTRGVDVGARRQVHAAIRRFAGRGAGVLLASSDADQLGAVCDRILVMADGQVSGRGEAGPAGSP